MDKIVGKLHEIIGRIAPFFSKIGAFFYKLLLRRVNRLEAKQTMMELELKCWENKDNVEKSVADKSDSEYIRERLSKGK